MRQGKKRAPAPVSDDPLAFHHGAGQARIMNPTAPGNDEAMSPPPPGRRAPALLAIAFVCIVIELVLAAADTGLVGAQTWRGLAYQNGAFWPGLLHSWLPNYTLQPAVMFVTYAFLHAGLGHLAGNMITLFVLGEIVVERVGQAAFVGVYLAATLGGAAAYGLVSESPQPMVGASGAIFGLAGAWQFGLWADTGDGRRRHWHLVRVLVLLALLNLVLWLLLDGRLAWQAHLGGFVFGWSAAALLQRTRRRRRR